MDKQNQRVGPHGINILLNNYIVHVFYVSFNPCCTRYINSIQHELVLTVIINLWVCAKTVQFLWNVHFPPKYKISNNKMICYYCFNYEIIIELQRAGFLVGERHENLKENQFLCIFHAIYGNLSLRKNYCMLILHTSTNNLSNAFNVFNAYIYIYIYLYL